MIRSCIIYILSITVFDHFTSIQTSSSLPSFLNICHRSDSELNDCIKHSVNNLRSHLTLGIPALHIPPCEPLHIPRIEISQAAGPVAIKSTYSNIKMHGGTDFVLKNVQINKTTDNIKIQLFMPKLQMYSDYDMSGKILILPVNGKGKARANFTDIDVDATIEGEHYENEETSRRHFKVTLFHVNFDIGSAQIHLENLFNGDELLSKATNIFINENWRNIADEIKPRVEEKISELFMRLANNIYSTFSIDILLPP